MITTTGAFLNALGILLGAILGLALRKPVSLRTQVFFRSAIGAFTVFLGLRLIFEHVGGGFFLLMKQLSIGLGAVILGFWLGKLFGFQKSSNRIGRIAANTIAAAQKNSRPKIADGFNACVILFCAAPLGIIGAIADGLVNYFYLLALKAFMDMLAMASFVRLFRWPSALSAIPVFVFFSLISELCRIYALPFLDAHGLTHSVCVAGGMISCIVTVVIFEVRKVELANYLPALAVAPLLTFLFR
ncbi:MAG TPA: DUF554 family protein [Verrucomicrobiae bacterium]|nr:DUF554 family protein [Verrucomicrobiae bacterium]